MAMNKSGMLLESQIILVTTTVEIQSLATTSMLFKSTVILSFIHWLEPLVFHLSISSIRVMYWHLAGDPLFHNPYKFSLESSRSRLSIFSVLTSAVQYLTQFSLLAIHTTSLIRVLDHAVEIMERAMQIREVPSYKIILHLAILSSLVPLTGGHRPATVLITHQSSPEYKHSSISSTKMLTKLFKLPFTVSK